MPLNKETNQIKKFSTFSQSKNRNFSIEDNIVFDLMNGWMDEVRSMASYM